MGLFGDDENEHLNEQIEIHEENIKISQEILEELDGVDTPEAELQRRDLMAAINQSNINIENIRTTLADRGIEAQDQSPDFFND